MFPFGVTFYPDQWPQDTWDKNLKEIKAAGFNIIRFGEMSWDLFEPTLGKFDFSVFDAAMDACHKHGLKVLLGIPTSQVPPWFHKKFGGSRPVAQDGTLYPEYGPRPNVCKDNRNYRILAENLAKNIASRYRKHPALYMWQVDNEPVYPPLDHTTSNDFCHCEDSRLAFIVWVKKKYGCIEKVNEAWGSKFWTNTLSSFEDIRTPKGGVWEAVSPHVFLDWFRFKSDRITEWVSHLAKIVKEIDPEHKVGTNGFIGICTRTPEHDLVPANLDWYGLDVYPKGNSMTPLDYSFALDLWRSFTRGTSAEFHITELQGGQNVRWGSPNYVEGPEIEGWTKTALKHGAKAILYHAWRPPLFGAETGGFGILKTDGSSTKRLEVVTKLAKEILNPKYETLNKSKNLNSKVAIAYLRSSEVQTYQEQGPPRAIVGQWEPVRSDIGVMHSLMSMQGAYNAVFKGTPIDFIFERDLDSVNLQYKTILLPNPYLLSEKQYANLKKWIAAGGTLITEARFGLKNENGHLYPNPLLEDLMGVTHEYTIPTPKGFFDGIKEKNLPTGRQAKKPQIITKKIGKGKAIYANFSLFLEIKNGNKKLLQFIKKTV
ncbi:MAG: alpha-amylase family protein [Candidatus Margulisiibacteriota bacterium]